LSAGWAWLAGEGVDFAGGMAWDMLVNKQSFEEAFLNNLLGFGIGGLIGHGGFGLTRFWKGVEVRIVGFQGARRESAEALLIRLGHIGVSTDAGSTIYGFRPTDSAAKTIANEIGNNPDEALQEFLRNRNAIRGGLYNDTPIFFRAAELSKLGKPTSVWQIREFVTPREFNQIKATIEKLSKDPESYLFWYSLPVKPKGSMPIGCNNCGTFPRVLGLDIPEDTGNLIDYITQLRNLGSRWP
jgi:hypothetical protein